MRLGHDTIVTFGTRLPPALGIFGRLQKILREDDSDLDDIVALVRVDPGLTFQVIKLSNSALYGLKSSCESLEQAVARVGFGDIHQLVGLAVARQAFQEELTFYDLPAGRLWENAVAAGTLMSAFAKRAGADAGAAYSTGLLRNIGKVILNNYPGAVCYPGEAACPNVHAWEQETHGLHAAEVSAVLLDHWRFPAEMVDAVRHQLAPEAAGTHAAHAARLHLACAIAADWGCALPGEGTGWGNDEALCGLAGLSPDDLPGAMQEARAQFGRCAVIEWSNAA
jgi:HD-like signal output (HDOD) protein